MNLYVISGVAGMTGNELARLLLKQKQTIIGFDNFFASSRAVIEDLFSDSNFRFYEYDLTNTSQMEEIKELVKSTMSDYEKVIYINCAAVVHTEHFYKIEETFSPNVLGMKEFLNQAIDVHADIFINCSTSEVYSMQSWNENGGVRENDFLLLATAEHSQRTSYATGKLLTEFFMKDVVDQGLIKGCSIRFANVYSKNEKYAKHIIPYIIAELKDKNQITLLENSRVNKRTFLHNVDSCRAVLALINSTNALDGTVYNVATEEEISIVDLVYLIAGKMNIKQPEIHFEGFRSSDPERRLLNTDKIRSRTDWNPIISLSEGIEMCLSNELCGEN